MEKESTRSHIYRELPGKVALVTGASSGLGRHFCLCLARYGCNIVAAARRMEMLQPLCEEISALGSGVRAVPLKLDVSGQGDVVEEAVNSAWKCFGKIDVLVNNAGLRGNVATALDLAEEEWDKVIRTNLKGCWVVSKAIGKRMRDSKIMGSIINISSIGGLQRGEVPGGTAYVASKAAINAITKIMALELGEYGIRVNSVAPGLFQSEITAGLMDKSWLSTVATRIVPLQRWGDVNQGLTSIILLLASDSSAYITGNVFIVDGGQSIPGNIATALDLAEEEWDKVIRTNLKGCWVVSKAIGKCM